MIWMFIFQFQSQKNQPIQVFGWNNLKDGHLSTRTSRIISSSCVDEGSAASRQGAKTQCKERIANQKYLGFWWNGEITATRNFFIHNAPAWSARRIDMIFYTRMTDCNGENVFSLKILGGFLWDRGSSTLPGTGERYYRVYRYAYSVRFESQRLTTTTTVDYIHLWIYMINISRFWQPLGPGESNRFSTCLIYFEES